MYVEVTEWIDVQMKNLPLRCFKVGLYQHVLRRVRSGELTGYLRIPYCDWGPGPYVQDTISNVPICLVVSNTYL